MKEYTLKTDTNTIWMKIIRYIGTLMLGFFLGATFIKYRNGTEIDWLNFVSGTLCSLALSFFPGFGIKQSITINEDGIFSYPRHTSFSGYKSEYKWDKIASVKLEKNKLQIKTTVGSTDNLPLPYYTTSQRSELNEVLQEYDAWLKEEKNISETV